MLVLWNCLGGGKRWSLDPHGTETSSLSCEECDACGRQSLGDKCFPLDSVCDSKFAGFSPKKIGCKNECSNPRWLQRQVSEFLNR